MNYEELQAIRHEKYIKAKEQAKACTSYKQVDAFLESIENEKLISDRQFYNLKYLAIDSVYKFQVMEAMKK